MAAIDTTTLRFVVLVRGVQPLVNSPFFHSPNSGRNAKIEKLVEVKKRVLTHTLKKQKTKEWDKSKIKIYSRRGNQKGAKRKWRIEREIIKS